MRVIRQAIESEESTGNGGAIPAAILRDLRINLKRYCLYLPSVTIQLTLQFLKTDMSWTEIEPDVNSNAEFFEIVNDFGNPLEIIREAVSNSIDWKADYMKISFDVETINGTKRLVIRLSDNGLGMTEQVLKTSFWGLGHSDSRKLKEAGDKNIIGEKGHGTKIYLRSEEVQVKTKTSDGIFESICKNPYKSLSNHTLHQPQIRQIENFLDDQKSGTEITVIGYNDNAKINIRAKHN